MVSYGTHSVLETPDLWANIVVYVTVEFPIMSPCFMEFELSRLREQADIKTHNTMLYLYF